MKLYQLPFSPNCQKVVSLAREVGLDLELVSLDIFKGEAKTPGMLAKNPNGKVPILEDGDFVLWESCAMLAYVAAAAGRTDLAPTAPRERADVERWMSWGTAHFAPAIRKVAFERIVKKLAGRGEADEAIVKAGTAEFATVARVLEESLGDDDYVCGRLGSCGLDLSPFPKVSAWLSRMTARDSIKRTLAASSLAA